MNTLLVSGAAAAALAGLLTVTIANVAAQAPPAQIPATDGPLPGFEASIKRSQENPGFIAFRSEPAGRTMNGAPLRQLIVQSYGIQQNQLIGGPDWVATERWDIQLRADTAVTPAQVNLLLQRMMADRFKLVVHRETRELPIYELRLARTDGRLGSELKPAEVDCGPQGRGRPGGPPPVAPGAAVGRGGLSGGGCRMLMSVGRVEAAGQPLTQLTSFLAGQLGRPVIDKTGLTGSYDLVLSWTPDGGGRGFTPPPGGPQLPPIDPNGPPLVTALQEQLGLKVEATRGPVEVLVIDSVQQPTEN